MGQYIYKMAQVDSSWDDIQNHFDCFLVAGGSDFRAYEVLRKAQDKGVSIGTLYFFDFEERKEGLGEKLQEAYDGYKKLGFSTVKIPCSTQDPSSCIKSLAGQGIDFSKHDSLAIDISCFTKPYFFLILKHLKSLTKFVSVSVFYSEPKSYVFPKGIFSSYKSSLGPLSILEIPGYTGSDERGQKRMLVIFLGFDGDLSREINEDVAPSETLIVNGFPGYAPKFKDISLICNERLIQEKHSNLNYSRSNNPFEAFNLLETLKADEKIRKRHGSLFMNIAPLGTKPMALGACLFAIHNPEVRIVYPMPENYVKVTTDKSWKSWIYNIPLILNN
jgi:hypothetical protein